MFERKITTCLPRLPPAFSGGPEKHGCHGPRYYILWAGDRRGHSWCLWIHRNNDLGNISASFALHIHIFFHILCWNQWRQDPSWIMCIPNHNSSDASVYLFMWYSKYFFLERNKRNRHITFQVWLMVELKTDSCEFGSLTPGMTQTSETMVGFGGGSGKMTSILAILEGEHMLRSYVIHPRLTS